MRNCGAELREARSYCSFMDAQHRHEEEARVVSALTAPVTDLLCSAGRMAGIVHASHLVKQVRSIYSTCYI